MNILKLPLEILIIIIGFLNVKKIFILQFISKKFNHILNFYLGYDSFNFNLNNKIYKNTKINYIVKYFHKKNLINQLFYNLMKKFKY